jgi:hypothetical protein
MNVGKGQGPRVLGIVDLEEILAQFSPSAEIPELLFI